MLIKAMGTLPIPSKILRESLSFSTGKAIAKDFAKASVNGTIDNIQFPFFGIANAIAKSSVWNEL